MNKCRKPGVEWPIIKASYVLASHRGELEAFAKAQGYKVNLKTIYVATVFKTDTHCPACKCQLVLNSLKYRRCMLCWTYLRPLGTGFTNLIEQRKLYNMQVTDLEENQVILVWYKDKKINCMIQKSIGELK